MVDSDWSEVDFYGDLQVHPDAPDDAIAEAFRRLYRAQAESRTPDEAVFKRLNRAHQVLRSHRQEYDAFRAGLGTVQVSGNRFGDVNGTNELVAALAKADPALLQYQTEEGREQISQQSSAALQGLSAMADIISNHLKVVQTISDAAPAVIIESRRGEDVHLRTTVSRSRWRRGTVLHAWSDGPQLNMPPKTDVRVWKFAGAGRPGEYGGLPGDLWMHVDVKRNWGVLALVSVLTLVSIGAIGWVLTGGLSAFGG